MIFLELFILFFLIGLFTIGGGYAMLPMIRDQVVARGWLTFEEINNFIAIAESTPGPFAVNTATLVGFEQGYRYLGLSGAVIGAVASTLGVVLPSFAIILLIARFFNNFLKYKWVKQALEGIKAIVVGLIFGVVLELIYNNVLPTGSLKSIDYFAITIMVVVFLIKLIFKKIGPIPLIIISGILGILFYYVIPLII